MDKIRVTEEEDLSSDETEDEPAPVRNRRIQGNPRIVPIESQINPKLKRKLATFEFSTSQENQVIYLI
jgi:hypothetical protein